MDQSVFKKLKCPACSGSLKEKNKIISCTACNTDYPMLDYIPWLLESPKSTLDEWKSQLKLLMQTIEADSMDIKSALQEEGLSELAQKRLRKLQQAKAEHAKAIREILKPLAIEDRGSKELSLALKATLPASQNLLSYYDNIHRDWNWGEKENKASLECIKDLVKETSLGELLVVGSGSSRLAYDIHKHNSLSPSYTLATDINPLLLLSARKIIRGKTVKLYEFPIAPKDINSYGVLSKCKAPEKLEKNFDFIFANILASPFKEQSFDTILTPWFIDIIPEEPKLFFKRLNQFIKLGGTWLNFGSLVLNNHGPAKNYSKEEIIEIIKESGFELEAHFSREIPYMQSPLSNHGRNETVFCFAAKKIKHLDIEIKNHKQLPSWITDTSVAVPRLPEHNTTETIQSISLDVIKLIDGNRSIVDIAKEFSDHHDISTEEAEGSINRFLLKLHKDGNVLR